MSRSPADGLLLLVTRAAAAVSAGVVVLIGLFLVRESWPALRTVGLERFLFDPSWRPAAGAADGTFGLAPMLAGTLAATAGALVLAVPVALLVALSSAVLAPPGVAAPLRRAIELLAGIPSVVFGFWGLVTLVPLVRQLEPPGPSLLAGSLVLALMILPTLALTADAAFRAVPTDTLRAGAALGLSRTATVFDVLLPASRSGLRTALVLATGRALGETMAVLMVCGNVVQTPSSVFDPIRTLTANIALEMAYAVGDHRAALFVSGLALAALVTLLVLLADWVDRPSRRRGSTRRRPTAEARA